MHLLITQSIHKKNSCFFSLHYTIITSCFDLVSIHHKEKHRLTSYSGTLPMGDGNKTLQILCNSFNCNQFRGESTQEIYYNTEMLGFTSTR